MKDQMFVFRGLENDGRFPPMTNLLLLVVR
jgi:hypothetical protein